MTDGHAAQIVAELQALNHHMFNLLNILTRMVPSPTPVPPQIQPHQQP